MTFTIDKLGFYGTRSGKVKEVIFIHPDKNGGYPIYPIEVKNGDFYTRKGQFLIHADESPYDLVEYLGPPKAPEGVNKLTYKAKHTFLCDFLETNIKGADVKFSPPDHHHTLQVTIETVEGENE